MPRHPDTTIMPNTVLSGARHRLPSPVRPGQRMSRSELADAVNAALDRIYSRRDVTAQYVDSRWVGKLERGEHRWPSEARRKALRQVLGVVTDADLDLYSPRRSDGVVDAEDRVAEVQPGSWDETIHLLREQWHLLVQNDKMFGPEYALMGVTRQLTSIEDTLYGVPQALRPAVVRLAAQYAESAAWLHQSLDDHAAGHRRTQQALAWADEIADPTMTAWATYRSSQQWLAAGHPTQAVEQADGALLHDPKLPGPMRAALRVQHAHALAATGEYQSAMRLLDAAHGWAADRYPGKPEGEHGSYCTSGYIEVHRGACLRLAQRPQEAIEVIDQALPAIPRRHRQDFASALLIKATAHAAARQPDQAAAAAHHALPIAHRAGSRRILHQLAQLGATVSEHQQLPEVHAFLHDLQEIT
ncbi:hypothetical protein [Micromonospora tulbaghiae]|uniref:hypothetical protein n=1 Tax=Micromonospora tulbaghiae TaxID=479978 RepID=UPI00340110CB